MLPYTLLRQMVVLCIVSDAFAILTSSFFFYILTQYNASIKVKTAIYNECKCSAACLLHLAAVELASKWIRMHILNGGH